MKSLQIYLGIALLTAAHPSRCGNECDFHERCEGNVLQTCGEGVDQCVSRHLREEVCAAPNETCVSAGTRATCARSPEAQCDASFVPRCDGTLLLTCSLSPAGFVVAEDCAAVGRTCANGTSGGAACAPVAAADDVAAPGARPDDASAAE